MAEIGTILGGRYRLVELLGQGGMATIFRAVDTQLGRDVAVKLLRPEYLRDPDFSARFRQEAQAAASLTHPNVVTVVRLRRGPVRPVHRHGARRRRGPRDDPAPERRAAAAAGRAHRRRRRPRARRGARARPRPSRHQARQRPDRPRRPGQGRRLRHRPRDRRGADDAPGHDARIGPLLQPGAGPRRARDGRVGHLLAGHRPVRDAHRRPAVGGRQRRGGRARPAVRPGPGPDGGPRVRPARPRGDHAQGARPRAR